MTQEQLRKIWGALYKGVVIHKGNRENDTGRKTSIQ